MDDDEQPIVKSSLDLLRHEGRVYIPLLDVLGMMTRIERGFHDNEMRWDSLKAALDTLRLSI